MVLFLDDLQWSDPDGDALLAELVRWPAPPVLVIAAFRTDHGRAIPLRAALAAWDPAGSAVAALEVEALAPADAERLARALLGPGRPAEVAQIAREAGGSPLFLDALARTVPTGPAPGGQPATFASMVTAQLRALPDPARALLEIAAIAAGPIDRAVAAAAAGPGALAPHLDAALTAAHLIRSSAIRDRAHLDCYHDRIRQVVLAAMPPGARAARHAALAHSLERSGVADAELVARHHDAAGHPDRAAHFLARAAIDAEHALAFDRAARLLTRLLEHARARGRPDDPALRERLGDALSHAGRGADAADAYLAAAHHRTGLAAIDLRRRAADGLLLSGHPERGMRVVREVVAALGMRLPGSRRAALAALLLRRGHLRVRGLGFRSRPAAALPAAARLRLDTCWSIASGLSMVDPLVSAVFQAQHLALALDAGDPVRGTRALASDAAISSLQGRASAPRTAMLIARSHALAVATGDPYALGVADGMAGLARHMEGAYREALTLCDRGAARLRTHCTNVAYELGQADVFGLAALWRMGRWREMAARLELILADAAGRGDRHAATYATLLCGWNVGLMRDAPVRTRGATPTRRSTTPRTDRSTCATTCTASRSPTSCSTRGARPTRWPPRRPSCPRCAAFLLRIEQIRYEFNDLVARAALAATLGAGTRDRRHHLALAEASVRRIERERVPWIAAIAGLRRAELAIARGQRGLGQQLAEQAARALRAADLGIFALVADRVRGELTHRPRGGRAHRPDRRRAARRGHRQPRRAGDDAVPDRRGTVGAQPREACRRLEVVDPVVDAVVPGDVFHDPIRVHHARGAWGAVPGRRAKLDARVHATG